MKKILFIDRDGTLILEPPDEQIDGFEKLKFYPGAISAMVKIASETDFELVMVTNQDGLGTDSFPEKDFWPVQNFIMETLAGEGVVFKAIHIDKTFPHENAKTRKPGIAMLTDYLRGDYDIKNSFVIGDRLTDVKLAQNLGCKAFALGGDKIRKEIEEANLYQYVARVTQSWEEIYTDLITATFIIKPLLL